MLSKLVLSLIAVAVGASAPGAMPSEFLFNASLARTLARYASATQCSAAALAAWTCAACVAANPAFEVGALIYDAPTDSLALVGWDASLASVLVLFRPTMTDSLVDWIEDAEMWQTGFTGAPGCDGSSNNSCAVHAGFSAVFEALEGRVLAATAAATAAHPGARVIVAGHSLGGALATLGAAAIASSSGGLAAHSDRRQVDPNAATPWVYTFGSPRVGNEAFASAHYDATLGNATWRVTHALDIVPQFPPRWLLDYTHVAREVWYNENNTAFRVCDASGEDPTCQDSVFADSSSDHMSYVGVNMSADAACGAG